MRRGWGEGVEGSGEGAEPGSQIGQVRRVESGGAGDLGLSSGGRLSEVPAALGRLDDHLAAVDAGSATYEAGEKSRRAPARITAAALSGSGKDQSASTSLAVRCSRSTRTAYSVSATAAVRPSSRARLPA